MSSVLAACRSAAFACSAALGRDELLQAVGRLPPERGGRLTSGVKEMRQVLELLGTGGGRPAAAWAIQDRLLHRRTGHVDSEVLVLAPSDEVLGAAYRSVARLLEQGLEGRVPKPERNLGAVVLWVEVGDATMLLGSDLQESPRGGWTAVLGCRQRIDRRSEIFKVPHHGSKNGHLASVWTQILVDRPEAVVCPHWNGGTILPGGDDLARLCQLANVHLTAVGRPGTIIQKGRPMRPTLDDLGRVTLRRRLGVDARWSVTYGGHAGNGCSVTSRP